MKLTPELIGRRFAWKERGDLVRYGTLKEIIGSFGNMKVEGISRERYYVPADTMYLVDDDGAPLTE